MLGVILFCGAAVGAAAQATQGDGTPAQRLEVMRSQLEATRRSLNSAISSLNATDSGDKKDGKAAADDPRTRLRGLEKEASSMLTEVNDLRGKLDRSERIETQDLEKLETSIADLNTRVQSGMQATASVRAAGDAAGGAGSKKKKKGRFLGIFGGGGDDDKFAELTGTVSPGRDRELFETAAREVRKGSYDSGRLLFSTIISTYPDSPFLPMAKLAYADSFYLEGTTSALIQASQAYQDWLTFFPTDPLSDRVMLKMAEAEMRQMGLANRDVTRARKAEQRLKALLQQFPNTTLREAVEQRLYEVQETLGLHSLQVARFYDEKSKRGEGGLKGAQSRLREILEKYPNFSYTDEVLFRLANLYVREEEPDEAAKYYQMLARDWPNSEYAEKAREQLNVIGAAVPEPDKIKQAMPPPVRPGMMKSLLTEVTGIADVTIDKNGVLISKDSKAVNDLIDIAIAHQGQLPPSAVPLPVQQRRAPARNLQQATPPAPVKPAASNSVRPATAPASQATPGTTPPATQTGTTP
jgi:outer membrane protein assembly factor BamD